MRNIFNIYVVLGFFLLLISCSEADDLIDGVQGKPIADFDASTCDCEAPCTIEFTNTSSNAINFTWNLGDESDLLNTRNTSHTYTETGEYTVVLFATNADGDQDVKEKTLFISSPNNNNGISGIQWIIDMGDNSTLTDAIEVSNGNILLGFTM
jgi:PKD repeat protein